MARLLEGDQLESWARKLGIGIAGDAHTQSTSGRSPRASGDELQRRIIATERAMRESRMPILTPLSAIAAVLSAIAAILAVIKQ